MEKPRSAAPLTIAILLLFLAIYFGSYLVLVIPRGKLVRVRLPRNIDGVSRPTGQAERVHYRIASSLCQQIFWPLEQLDRQARPGAWNSGR